MKKKPSKKRCEKKGDFWKLRPVKPGPPQAPTNTYNINKTHKTHSTLQHASGAFGPGADIFEQRTLLNLTCMGAGLRTPGSCPSQPSRLWAPFSSLRTPFCSPWVHFTNSRLHFVRSIAGYWILESQIS